MPITARSAKLCRVFARSRKRRADPIGILLDTQGPAIRTGDLKTDLHLKQDDILELTVAGAKSEEPYSVDVNYDGLIDDVSVGDTILVDSGMIRLVVLEKRGKRIRCKVLTPGTLGSRRHINLPGVHVNLPPLTKKDLADISLGVELGVDFFALSFVRQKSDLDQLHSVLTEKKCKGLSHRQNRGSTGGPRDQRHDRRGRRHHDRPGRSGNRMPNGGTADHPAADREILPSAGKAGDCRHANARIDDHESRCLLALKLPMWQMRFLSRRMPSCSAVKQAWGVIR